MQNVKNEINKKKISWRMTPELEKLLGKVEEDIKNKRNLVGPFKSAKEMNVYLDSHDK
jgi:hypothetical protein